MTTAKIFSERLELYARRYNCDFDEFTGIIHEAVKQLKDVNNVGDVIFELDYEGIYDEDFFGNNDIWPIKVYAVCTSKKAFDQMIQAIQPYL